MTRSPRTRTGRFSACGGREAPVPREEGYWHAEDEEEEGHEPVPDAGAGAAEHRERDRRGRRAYPDAVSSCGRTRRAKHRSVARGDVGVQVVVDEGVEGGPVFPPRGGVPRRARATGASPRPTPRAPRALELALALGDGRGGAIPTAVRREALAAPSRGEAGASWTTRADDAVEGVRERSAARRRPPAGSARSAPAGSVLRVARARGPVEAVGVLQRHGRQRLRERAAASSAAACDAAPPEPRMRRERVRLGGVRRHEASRRVRAATVASRGASDRGRVAAARRGASRRLETSEGPRRAGCCPSSTVAAQ